MFSFKQVCKQRLKGLFIGLRQANPNVKSYILVVDAKTVKIVSTYLKMSELLEMGVVAVENLSLARKPFQIDVIYFITASMDSAERLVGDFKDKAMYKIVHIFFNNKIQQPVLMKLQSEPNLTSKIVTCKSFNFDFACLNDNLFTLEYPHSLEAMRGKGGLLIEIAERLSTALISFERFYEFEIIFRTDNKQLCQQLAQAVQIRLRELLESLKKANSSILDPTTGKVRVIILDRTLDPLSPLLHDFYYQPMFYDLLSVDGDIIEYNDRGQVKKAQLNDNDELFKKYKYRHIGEVLEGVANDFQTFIKTNSAAKMKNEQLDLKSMTEIVRSMPQYNELVQKYTMHMEIVEKTLQIFQDKSLSEIGELEQTLATGFDRKGESVPGAKLITRILKILQTQSEQDKLRLILAAMIQIEVGEKDRKSLTDIIGPDSQFAIHNLKFLGVQLGSASGKSHKRVKEDVKKYAKNKMANEALELCRNTPVYEQVIEEILVSKNLPAGFERIIINEQAQNKPKSLRQKGQLQQLYNADDASDKDKVVIFSIGGMGYNEVRSILNNAVIKNHIAIVGSTTIMKPNDYVKDLISLSQI